MIAHDCGWVGRCGCVENGTLCVCGHQLAYHAADTTPDGGLDFTLLDPILNARNGSSRGECELGVAADLKWSVTCPCERFVAVLADVAVPA